MNNPCPDIPLVASLCLLLVVGCATAPPRTALMTDLSKTGVTAAEVSYPLFDFMARFSRIVDAAAEHITEATSKPDVRRNALRWKMNASLAAFLALEHADPVAMIIDLWALCAQMTDYFESGAGNEEFGGQQDIAIAASRQLELEIATVATQILQPEVVAGLTDDIAQWILDHPIENLHFARSSIISLQARLLADRPQGFFATVRTLEGQMADLKGRLALHADHLPRQARWQAELLVNDMAGRLVGTQLTNAFQLLALERQVILETIDRQRRETLEALRSERVAALESVSQQRLATLEEMHTLLNKMMSQAGRLADAQLEAVVKAIDVQRRDTLAELRSEPITLRHDLEPLVRSTVDRAFARLLMLLGISYVVLLVTALLGYALFRKHGHSANADIRTR